MLTSCLVCGKESTPVQGILEQPYGATLFTSYGHYGSTVYDPPGWGARGRYLQIVICDDCLRQKHDQIKEVVITPRESIFDYRDWDPDAEE